MKTNWNDYWFQGDKLIRDFDAMYRDIDEPWLQRERAFQPRLFVGLSLLQWMLREDPSRKLEILDVGAGLGGPTEYLRPFGKITATDISEAAVEKAQKLVADVNWVVDDIRVYREEWHERFDLIWMSEVLVLVLTEIDDALPNVLRYMKPDGHMIFNYYMPDNAWSSRYLKDSRALYDKLSEYFKIEAYVDLNPFDGSQRELLGLLSKPA
jgi:SAM-dependent methyltransferase